MLIGIDASRANLEKKTGTEWYSFFLIQELKKTIPSNYKVVLYSKEPLRNGLEELPVNWSSAVLTWPPKFLWTQIRLSIEMLKFWSRPKLLFVPAHTIPLIHPRRTILVAHDIGFERMKNLYEQKDVIKNNSFLKNILKLLVRIATLGQYNISELDYHRWAMRYAVKHATQIITVSNFSKKEIHEFYRCPKQNITVVYNGFDKHSFFRFQNKTSEKYCSILEKYKIKTPYILFTGRLEQKKNLVNLVSAYKLFVEKYKQPHYLVLLGSIGYGYEDIEAKIFELKLKDQIIEPGYVDQKDMNTIMNLADLFVLPSFYEGFGIPVLEALAAGTPVVCSNIEPLIEIAGNSVNYFDPNNPNEIAQVINETINDNFNKQINVKNGQQIVKKYSYQKCAQETWQCIEKFL
ncbi:MAG: glycosyltransferase family 1 protein [Patescibacteria group bacterium]